MPGKNFDPRKEAFICERLVKLIPPSQIAKEWTKEYPDENHLSLQSIQYYILTRKNKIEDMRQSLIEKTVEKAMEVPIANEKVRLQRMEDLYHISSTILMKKDKISTGLDCLREARQEVKGDTASTQNYLQLNQFNELTNEQLMDKKRELEQKFIDLSKKGVNSYAQIQSP